MRISLAPPDGVSGGWTGAPSQGAGGLGTVSPLAHGTAGDRPLQTAHSPRPDAGVLTLLLRGARPAHHGSSPGFESRPGEGGEAPGGSGGPESLPVPGRQMGRLEG